MHPSRMSLYEASINLLFVSIGSFPVSNSRMTVEIKICISMDRVLASHHMLYKYQLILHPPKTFKIYYTILIIVLPYTTFITIDM